MSDNGRLPRIAVDAMGGDYAPERIVAGAALAAREGKAEIVLVGDRERLEPIVRGHRTKGLTIVHAAGTVAMDESPSSAVRRPDETSLGKAIDLVRTKEADAVVSAGNSGAFLAIALIRLRTIPGIARPAIAAVLPARSGPVVLLDAGANVDCRPEWLAQFGVMGSAYSRGVLGVPEPRVGIISVGEEPTKGNAQTLDAAALLANAPIRFIGNVEGKDVFGGGCDVVVADGFVGNVMLKLSEGLATMIGEVVSHELRSGDPLAKIGALLARSSLARVRTRISYDTYGGAPLLGLRGNCIVAHGRSNERAIASAIRAAVAEVREGVQTRIADLAAPVPISDAR